MFFRRNSPHSAVSNPRASAITVGGRVERAFHARRRASPSGTAAQEVSSVATAGGRSTKTTRLWYHPCRSSWLWRVFPMLDFRVRQSKRRHLLGRALLVAAAGVCVPALARAHFILMAPDAWMSQDAFGLPEKLGPCGDE